MLQDTQRPWVDSVWEKHECFDYSPRTVPITLVDRVVELLLPSDLPDFTVLAWAEQEGLLFLILRLFNREFDMFSAAVVVARRTGDNVYATTVWHEMYTHALFQLGLVPEEQAPW